MTRRTVRIAMNGVTGRMGYRQHLVRSILAIREQGGLDLGDGQVLWPEPVLVGRRAHALEALAAQHGLTEWSTDLDAVLADESIDIYFDAQVTSARVEAIKKAIAAGKHVYTEKPTATDVEGALDLARLARDAGIKHGVVQDKIFLPGLLKLKRLIDGGFFGEILSVRGEFGYWVFEGDWQDAQRPSWNYRAEDGGGIVVDMFPHWEYVLHELFGQVTSVSAHVQTHIPQRWDEQGKPYAATADDAAYGTFQLGRRRRRPDQLLLGRPRQPRRARRVPGRRHPRLRRRGTAQLPCPAPLRHTQAGLEPRPPGHRAVPRPVAGSPGQRGVRQRLQGPVGALPAPHRPRRALHLGPHGGRPRRPARRARPQVLGRGPPLRRTGAEPVTIHLPQGPYEPRTTPLDLTPDGAPLASRTVFSAAHVVADPYADISPDDPVAVDWDATLAFRRHLWSHGLGVAEAMDTAQRGMGLDWAGAAELIRRSAAEAKSVGGRIACGVGTDQLTGPATLPEVRAAYEEQLALVEESGAQAILMASRALAAAANGPEDYLETYAHLLRQATEPVVLHWLGPMFDPALEGYWGSADLDAATDTFLKVIAEHPDKVDGIKISLLDAEREIDVRRRLPSGVRCYTGDDFNYPELIAGTTGASATPCSASSTRSARWPRTRCGSWTPGTYRGSGTSSTPRSNCPGTCSRPRPASTRPAWCSSPGWRATRTTSRWSAACSRPAPCRTWRRRTNWPTGSACSRTRSWPSPGCAPC